MRDGIFKITAKCFLQKKMLFLDRKLEKTCQKFLSTAGFE